MKFKILFLLFLLFGFSGYAGSGAMTTASAENKMATGATAEALQVADNEPLTFHVLQKTNFFSILIVVLEILFILYLIWAGWVTGIR